MTAPRSSSDRFPPVAELVPHEPPMVLIDELVAWTPERARVRAQVRAGSPFVEAGRAPAVVLIEVMAQAIAAASGMAHHLRGGKLGRGVLLGTRELELAVDELRVGDELAIDVVKQLDDGKTARYACTVEREGQTIARAELNVMIVIERQT
ncbi:3-hydroxylacyl-ACP dehydratase [Nannocystaceae bacterium ST9]